MSREIGHHAGASADAGGDVAEKLTAAQREAVLALHGSAWRRWPERRLRAMLDGLGKHGLREMRDVGVLTKDGTSYVLTSLGDAVRSHILSQTTQDDAQ